MIANLGQLFASASNPTSEPLANVYASFKQASNQRSWLRSGSLGSKDPDSYKSCPSCFTLEANRGNSAGKCVTLSTGFRCNGYDPLSCTFHTAAPHARMKECYHVDNPGYKRQCFFYDVETQQIWSQESEEERLCLTVMVPDDVDYTDKCDACSTMIEGGPSGGDHLVGGLVATWPCLPGRNPWQAWTLENGLIKSGCDHGLYLADAYPFLILMGKSSYRGAFLLTFGNEQSVPVALPDAATTLVRSVLGQETALKLGSHGCWCSVIGRHSYSGGSPVDALDQICKDWSQARRCAKSFGGSCFGSGSGLVEYQVSGERASCPWREDGTGSSEIFEEGASSSWMSCGVFDGHLNSSGCQRDLCLIDVKFLGLVEDYFRGAGLEEWSPVPGDQATCHPCPNCSGDGSGAPVMRSAVCEGVAPDLRLSFL